MFITHSLEEAKLVSDRITVLRDGRNVGTRKSSETTVPMLVELMSGRPAGTIFPIWQSDSAETSAMLAVQHMASSPKVRDVSFTIRPGEVVGLAGLVGSGRTETMKAIFGAAPIQSGTVRVHGEVVRFQSPADAISAGVAFIPEDRQQESLFPNHSVMENICIAAVSSSRNHGVRFGRHVLDRRRMSAVAERLRELLQIKTASIDAPVTSLSGGNQQKTVLARWLAMKPGIILADEPTRGISINNKIELYKLIRKLAADGAAIVIASSEFEELVGLCDRIFIIRDGMTEGEIDVTGLTADALLEAVLSRASRSELVHEG
jgi:ribose transport system ATP-binding protein